MKRVIYEWGAILFAAISILGIANGGVSLVSDIADFDLSIGRGSFSFQMAAYDGRWRFCDHSANLEVIEIIGKRTAFEPKPNSNLSWSIPGLEFHHIRFAESAPVWSLSISTAILVFLSVCVTGLCVRVVLTLVP